MKNAQINIYQFIIGLLTFLFGLLIYILHRVDKNILHGLYYEKFYLQFGNYFPDFIHPFSFTLITCSFLSSRLTNIILVSAGWLIFDILMELGQKYSGKVIIFIYRYFEMIPFIDFLVNYFSIGIYDSLDLFFIIFGSLFGFLIAYLTKI